MTNTDLVEKGLTKLILVLKELPKDLLDEQEGGFLYDPCEVLSIKSISF